MTNEKANDFDNHAGGAAWNVVLTDEELGALTRGVSPLCVRPEALVSYTAMPPMFEKKTHWEFVARKTSRGHATHWEKHVTEERKPFFIDDFGHPWFLTEDGQTYRHDYFENAPADSHTETRRQEMTKLDPEVEKKIEKLEKEREILLDALAFYASWETYFGIGFFPDPPCGEFMTDFSFAEGDYGSRRRPGRRAREAAGKLGLELHYEYEDDNED